MDWECCAPLWLIRQSVSGMYWWYLLQFFFGKEMMMRPLLGAFCVRLAWYFTGGPTFENAMFVNILKCFIFWRSKMNHSLGLQGRFWTLSWCSKYHHHHFLGVCDKWSCFDILDFVFKLVHIFEKMMKPVYVLSANDYIKQFTGGSKSVVGSQKSDSSDCFCYSFRLRLSRGSRWHPM